MTECDYVLQHTFASCRVYWLTKSYTDCDSYECKCKYQNEWNSKNVFEKSYLKYIFDGYTKDSDNYFQDLKLFHISNLMVWRIFWKRHALPDTLSFSSMGFACLVCFYSFCNLQIIQLVYQKVWFPESLLSFAQTLAYSEFNWHATSNIGVVVDVFPYQSSSS